MDEAAVDKLERIFDRYHKAGDNIISAMQEIQNAFGFVPEEAVHWFSEKSAVPTSKIFGILTFYTQFYLKPRGKNVITACCGTVCHVKGSQRIISRLQDELKLKDGQDTTRDGQYTLEKVACLGACSIAPVVVLNKRVYGKMNPDKMVKLLVKKEDKKSG